MSIKLSHPSVADISESDLVNRLMADFGWKSRLTGIHGIPDDVSYYTEIPHDGLGKQGDIDILLVNPSQPALATAIQIKRIKVTADTFQTQMPNKLAELKKLHQQSNRLVELGFWQVYSYALIVVDSRLNNRGEYKFDGLTTELRTKIDNALTTEGLNEHAGFIRFELVQPVDNYPLGAGTCSITQIRAATVKQQSAEVTDWIKTVAV